jgi:hypothetical protein
MSGERTSTSQGEVMSDDVNSHRSAGTGASSVGSVGSRTHLESPGNWAWRQGPIQQPGQAVVFDVDGVLSDAVGRQHFLERGRRDWDRFFAACGDDPVIEVLARLMELLDPKLQVILLTGRPFSVQPQTLAWLQRYGLRWDLLVMRARGDYSQVTSFKRDEVGELRAFGFDLRLAFEDDPNNFAMFHAEGIPCVYIHSGYYD